MRKALAYASIIFMFLVSVALLACMLLSNIAYASPAMTTVDARPTAYTETGGMIGQVTNPTSAYDGSLSTSANFKYDQFTGSFEVKTFTTPSSNPIAFVDFKMNYEATEGTALDPGYRIVYYVGASGPVVLVPWTYAAHAQATETWSSQAEPNDGTWSWTDIGNIRFVVETAAGKKGDTFDEYEAWVTVTTYQKGTMWVNPASTTDPSSPFTVNIEIASVDDLYGWEFKLYYKNNILSNGIVTEGTFLSSAGSTFFSVVNNTDTYNATHGRYWVTCTLLGDIAGVSGSGTLATITFTVDGPAGTTPLDLVDTKLVGYEFTKKQIVYMTHDTTDGTVTITAVPEFPLGAAVEIALGVVIVYFWWKRKQKNKPYNLSPSSLR